MRICHTIPSIAEEASGPSYSVVRLCSELQALGDTVTLAAIGNSGNGSPEFLHLFSPGFGPGRLGRSPEMLGALDRLADKGDIDLLHTHSLWMMPNVYPGRIAAKAGLPLVVSPRGTLSDWAMRSGSKVKRLFWPFVQRPAISSAAAFHATAPAECEDIRKAGFLQPVAVIPNGIDIPESLPIIPPGQRTLLFLGRIHPVKGIDLLLPAWKAVQERFPEWRLRIVGPDNGGYLERMRRLSNDLRLYSVTFDGGVYGIRKWQTYGEAEIFVLPSRSENFGVAVAEALASGTPAIVSQGAPWSGLEHHGAGWWPEVGIDPLVAALESALSCTPEQLAGMGFRGRQWMVAEYSWQEAAHKMHLLYKWLLYGGKQPEFVM